MRQTAQDERYEDIILQALAPEYEKVRTASYARREFRLDDIRHMVHTLYVDNFSPSVNAMPFVGLCIAMQVVGHTSSDVQCNYCKGFGHVTQELRHP